MRLLLLLLLLLLPPLLLTAGSSPSSSASSSSSSFSSSSSASSSSFVYVIRHGEKVWALGCLSAAGEARAHALPGIFNGAPSTRHATFAIPTAIYANFYDDHVDCERCNQTVTPIAERLGLAVNLSYGFPKKLGGNQLAAQVMRARALDNNTVLAAWEHVNIKPLVEAFGVDAAQVPSWPGSDYDTVYVLELSRDTGKLLHFSIEHENFTAPSGIWR